MRLTVVIQPCSPARWRAWRAIILVVAGARFAILASAHADESEPGVAAESTTQRLNERLVWHQISVIPELREDRLDGEAYVVDPHRGHGAIVIVDQSKAQRRPMPIVRDEIERALLPALIAQVSLILYCSDHGRAVQDLDDQAVIWVWRTASRS